jgi:hypothetical protein
MKIFILEDSKHRIRKIWERLYRTNDLVIHQTSFGALQYIVSHDFDYDVMLLDHDLGHRIFCGKNNKNTGYHFLKGALRYIRSSRKLKIIIIHSWNPIGAMRMKKLLKSTGKLVIWRPCRWPY